MSAVSIAEAAVADPRVRGLLEAHVAHSAANAPGTCDYTLDPDALSAAADAVFAAWIAERAVGVAALAAFDDVGGVRSGEVKSMHVSAEARGCGVGAALLDAVAAEAARRGYARLALETGTAEAYAPARRLYLSVGFAVCPPFAAYRTHPLSVYMARGLR